MLSVSISGRDGTSKNSATDRLIEVDTGGLRALTLDLHNVHGYPSPIPDLIVAAISLAFDTVSGSWLERMSNLRTGECCVR